VIGIGETLFTSRRIIFHGVSEVLQFRFRFPSAFHNSAFHNETILLKGAHAFWFQKQSASVAAKAHETVLEIDLNALVHNLNFIEITRLNAGNKIDGDGEKHFHTGVVWEMHNILQFHRVDYLAVAYADEGVELPEAGITVPIGDESRGAELR